MAVKFTYLCLTLLLVVGTQLATSKSVDDRTLALRKRQADEEAAEITTTLASDLDAEIDTTTTTIIDATTVNEEEGVTEEEETTTPAPVSTKAPTAKPPKPKRRQTVKASSTPAPTTPAEDENDNEEEQEEAVVEEKEEEEEAPTVKPLPTPETTSEKPKKTKKPKPKPTSRPQLLNRISPIDDNDEDLTRSPVKPSLVPPMPSYNLPPIQQQQQQQGGFFPPQPLDPGFYPWRMNLPSPASNYPDDSYQPLAYDSSSSYHHHPISPAAPSVGYDYPQPSGPAFSDGITGVSTGSGLGAALSGTSAFAGSFAGASASASAGGSGGTVATSINGVNGGSVGGGVASRQSQPQTQSQSQPKTASRFGGNECGPTPQQMADFNRKGASPNAQDDESVGIEVNGRAPSGNPAYTAGPNYGSISGPGYSASAGFGAGAPNYPNAIPQYGANNFGPNPYDLQNYFQQYFAALQAQQLAFQRQIEAQIQAQQQAVGTFASGGAMITNGDGPADPSARAFVSTQSSPNSASASTSVDSRFGGGAKSTVVAYPPLPNDSNKSNKSNNSNDRIWDQSNRVDSNFGGAPGAGFSAGGSPSSGPQSAYASGSIGPQGGFQTAQINPAAPGIFSRFGDDIPPPSGNNYGVFSSSSSSSSTGPDGKTKSQKTATVAVNDNGKISVKTVHDP